MPQMNMTRANNALKDFYLEGIRYQMNEVLSPFLQQIEKTTRGVTGGNITMALKYGKHGGIGARTDDGLLPTPNSRRLARASWATKNLFARIMISDKVIKASSDDRGAFADLFEAELEDCMNDAKDDFNRQLFGTNSGIMGTCAGDRGAGALTNAQVEVGSAQFFFEGQRVDILTAAGADRDLNVEITGVDRDNNVLTFSADLDAAVVATDIITRQGSYDLEVTGLGQVMTQGNTIYTINRATNAWFNPQAIDNIAAGPAMGDITETLIQQGLDLSETRAGGKPDYISTSHGVRRAFFALMASNKTHMNTIKYEGGFTALDFNGTPMVADKYAPANTLDILCKENFKLYRMADWNWLDKDGKILSRVTNRPVYEATLAMYADLGCDKPAAQVRISNIAEE